MSSTCPKCSGELPLSAEDCPHCGIVLSKFRDLSSVPVEDWIAVVNGKEFHADYLHLKAWIAEDRVKLTDRIKRPGGPWKTVGEYPELLITVTTGDLHVPYEPIDAIFAFDSHTSGNILYGGSGDPNRAFDGVKRNLRSICRQLGGHAVINCEFQYRVAAGTATLFGGDQAIEIFAYGTAVRYVLPRQEAAGQK